MKKMNLSFKSLLVRKGIPLPNYQLAFLWEKDTANFIFMHAHVYFEEESAEEQAAWLPL